VDEPPGVNLAGETGQAAPVELDVGADEPDVDEPEPEVDEEPEPESDEEDEDEDDEPEPPESDEEAAGTVLEEPERLSVR
jgi:hypothetical protein